MIKTIIFLMSTLVLSAAHAGPACTKRVAGIDEGVCPASIYALIINGDQYDSKMVAVTGFFAYGDIAILFSNRDMFAAGSVSDGLTVVLPSDRGLVSRLYDLNHAYVEIVGRFNARGSDTSSYHGFETAGKISDIRWVSKADAPWGYSEPEPPKSLQGSTTPRRAQRLK